MKKPTKLFVLSFYIRNVNTLHKSKLEFPKQAWAGGRAERESGELAGARKRQGYRARDNTGETAGARRRPG